MISRTLPKRGRGHAGDLVLGKRHASAASLSEVAMGGSGPGVVRRGSGCVGFELDGSNEGRTADAGAVLIGLGDAILQLAGEERVSARSAATAADWLKTRTASGDASAARRIDRPGIRWSHTIGRLPGKARPRQVQELNRCQGLRLRGALRDDPPVPSIPCDGSVIAAAVRLQSGVCHGVVHVEARIPPDIAHGRRLVARCRARPHASRLPAGLRRVALRQRRLHVERASHADGVRLEEPLAHRSR